MRDRLTREQIGLLVGLPIMVLVVFGGWLIWRSTAELDSIESRQLAWATIGQLTREHIVITVICTLVVVCTAIPIGIALTRPGVRRIAPVVEAVANAGQAAPAIGLLVLLAIWIGFGLGTAVLALSLYAFLPVLRNTITGLQAVDPSLVEAGRGMGMSALAVLLRLELPMAIPVIMAGVRTALVLVVGTATFATFINAGGLGALIQTGITLFRFKVLVSGALLVALLALIVDWIGRVLEMLVKPKGL
ncbi:ABC transporter permease [Enemella dayhoffiae]|uniref:ABC transporter permease n=1 Tax=Enemella dayhoffiae TaxID=2016507 RepID=A0A255H6E0_9ACTN|nr:ABC transporter permease [Enemella dayhoffiae]OYO23139.1 ABC transporter permease [Enemella dayhoffiae]